MWRRCDWSKTHQSNLNLDKSGIVADEEDCCIAAASQSYSIYTPKPLAKLSKLFAGSSFWIAYYCVSPFNSGCNDLNELRLFALFL